MLSTTLRDMACTVGIFALQTSQAETVISVFMVQGEYQGMRIGFTLLPIVQEVSQLFDSVV